MDAFWRQFTRRKKQLTAIMPTVVIFVTMIFIGCASYAFGVLSGAELKRDPLVIEQYPQIDEENYALLCEDAQTVMAETSATDASAATGSDVADDAECSYVGSVNGTKYYPPSCSLVERIKPANLRCFASEEQALREGYERTAACT